MRPRRPMHARAICGSGGNNSFAAPETFGWISAQETQKGEKGVVVLVWFFFFPWGRKEEEEGGWLYSTPHPTRALLQHFLVLLLEFRQDKNIAQRYTRAC